VSWLCHRELSAGNRVHINLSSGSKLVAFAAGLAGMAHLRPGKGSLYYVQPAGFSVSELDVEEHGHSQGLLDVEELDLMPVMLPDPLQMRVLNYLRHAEANRAIYRDLVEFLAEIPGSGYASARGKPTTQVRNWNNAQTTRMVRTILAPLHEQGLIEILSQGRQKEALLTQRGLLYASISALDKSSLRSPIANGTSPPQADSLTATVP
jgi:predicted transcriptional regulator